MRPRNPPPYPQYTIGEQIRSMMTFWPAVVVLGSVVVGYVTLQNDVKSLREDVDRHEKVLESIVPKINEMALDVKYMRRDLNRALKIVDDEAVNERSRQ